MEGGRLPLHDRVRQQLRDDRLWRREEERASLYNLRRIHCPCCKCRGRQQLHIRKVKDHLIRNGREPNFRVWRGPGERDDSDEEWEQEFRRPSRPHDGHIDEAMDMHAMIEEAFLEIDEAPTQHPTLEERVEDIVMEAFTVVDELAGDEDPPSDEESEGEPMGENGDGIGEDDNYGDPHELEEAIDELYHGAKSSILAATILIMTLCTVHGVSNKFADQLFTLFREHLLPSENMLPKNLHAAKVLIQKLGLNYKTIHACQAGCVLFRGQYEGATSCPKCNKPRYKDEAKKQRPWKVLRQFPLIPRLRRMFRTPSISELMVWHAKNTSTDGLVRHPCDSKAWKHVHENIDPSFSQEDRNIHLGLAADGVNPFKLQRANWSTWPVMLLNYNIPPWLTTKKFFIMLALLIPGKQSVTSQFFDVYLEPLVEELMQLWKGVDAYDVLKEVGSRTFKLRAVLLWTIHDFPGYGTVAGVAHQGYAACPVCGPDFKGEHSVELGKQTYTDTRRWLAHDDPWRSPEMKDHFNGRMELRGKPNVVTAGEQLQRAIEYQTWLDEGNREGATGDPSKTHGVKRRSILHNLPYWKVNNPAALTSLLYVSPVVMTCPTKERVRND